MIELDLRVLAAQGLGHDPPPEAGAREHVRLVDRVDRERRVARECDLRGDARDALDLLDAVDHRVPGDVLVGRDALLLVRTKVDAADELAHDDDVHALRDGRLERRVGEQRVGREVRRADVGVEAERLAQREQARLGAHFAVDAPLGAADGAWRGDSGFF